MVIYEIAKVNDPADGHEIKLYLTQHETQLLIQHALNHLASIGAVAFVAEKEGVNAADLALEDTGVPN